MAGRGPGGSGADPESRPEPLVHRRIQLILGATANLLVCQRFSFGRPESSVCVAALVGLNGQVVVRVVADDARAGEVGPGGRGLVVHVRGPAIQPADEKGRTLLGSRTAPLPDTQDRSVLAPGR